MLRWRSAESEPRGLDSGSWVQHASVREHDNVEQLVTLSISVPVHFPQTPRSGFLIP
jgi:hypothetical protein